MFRLQFKIILILCYLLWIAMADNERNDLFTSTALLERILNVEKLFITNLTNFMTKRKLEIANMKLIINQNLKDAKFKAKAFKILLNIQNSEKEYLKVFKDISNSNSIFIPSKSDLNGFVLGINRLQTVYGLTAKNIFDGNLTNGIHVKSKLTAYDTYKFGQLLNELALYDFALEWYRVAFDNFDLKRKQIFQLFEEFSLNQIENSINEVEQLNGIPKMSSDVIGVNDSKLLQAACRGYLQKPAREIRDLFCKYEYENHPFLRLAPIKVEIVNKSPYFVVFHDVIYDSEIEILKLLSFDELRSATVWDVDKNNYTQSVHRISKYALIENVTLPVIRTLDQRISDMTGLSMETSEYLQIANYGIGGHYDFHFDYFQGEDDPNQKFSDDELDILGDRIATVLFYLSTVPAGGATVWPHINVKLNPVKGTAAFWYNLNSNLKGNAKTLHSACPVIYGTKWAANQWIRSAGQLFTKPCKIDDSFGDVQI